MRLLQRSEETRENVRTAAPDDRVVHLPRDGLLEVVVQDGLVGVVHHAGAQVRPDHGRQLHPHVHLLQGSGALAHKTLERKLVKFSEKSSENECEKERR